MDDQKDIGDLRDLVKIVNSNNFDRHMLPTATNLTRSFLSHFSTKLLDLIFQVAVCKNEKLSYQTSASCS